MGRLLGFVLLLLALTLLLSLFREYEDWCREPQRQWNQPIENAEDVGLPSPEDNKLPNFKDMQPMPNPNNGGKTKVYSNLLYVVLDSDDRDETFRQFAQKFSALYPQPEHKITYYSTGAKTCMLSVPEANRMEICRRLPEQITGIRLMATPVEVVGISEDGGIPNDPALSDRDKSWHFEAIQARQAWTITNGSPEITIGIVDNYMDLSHPELAGDRCIHPYSVPKRSDDVAPDSNADVKTFEHGTAVTAVAAGNANNEGTTGIAPNCKFIPVSLGENLNTATQAEGILYCIYNGADVINVSIGRQFPEGIGNFPIDEQIRYAREVDLEQERFWDFVFEIAEKRNVTIVWAAGNSSCYAAMDPSKRNSGTIRVSATGVDNKKAWFSNYGNFADRNIKDCDISAPGKNIWNAIPNNSYQMNEGTSFSAPIITGVVALLKSVNPELTTAQIINILEQTGTPVVGHPEIGKLVQIHDALIMAQNINRETSEQ